MTKDSVTVLTGEARKALGELSPTSDDPLLSEVWELCVSVTNEAGSRFLEHAHGPLLSAAAEVRLYVAHLERVENVIEGSPLRVPRLAARPLRAAGRYIADTNDSTELVAFLREVPAIASAFGEYLIRAEGRQSRPVVDVLDLAVRAGAVFTDCLVRAVPPVAIAND